MFIIILISIIAPLYGLLNITSYTKKDIIYQISTTNISHKDNIIFLSNHVSFTDFIVDNITTRYSSKFLSRYMVALVFPLYYIYSFITYSIIFFKWINYETSKDIYNNLLVYPEGTRRINEFVPSKLKKD